MEKHQLPRYSRVDESVQPLHRRRLRRSRTLKFLGLGCLLFVAYAQWIQLRSSKSQHSSELSLVRLQADLAVCSILQCKPEDPSGHRERNARYIDGHKATLIKNATVWIGEPVAGTSPDEARLGKGFRWVKSDVLLQYGLIVKVAEDISESSLPDDCQIWNANGRQLTAGVIDMHSHTGVYPLPTLWGGSDGNELSSDITPQMRSIDGLDPMDHQLQVIKSGGVTTSLILPGSGNNMGGEAFLIKHAVGKKDGRAEYGVKDLLADPEQTWRYMKMACGENAKRVYGDAGHNHGPYSRMGESWAFRHGFEEARALVTKQDDWCSAATANGLGNMKEYLPQDLKWESLGAALRGQVHINTHCYTIPDLEAFVDHTNEFQFPIRAFHHAHQTYLVPEVLKRTWGGRAPAAALFADNMYYKVESYTGSEQAGKILYDNDITPVYVSDNPVLNAQHVVFEAAKAYGYGLPYHVALASVTSAPAELLGMGERLGKIKSGFDADITVWDSDPLSVGATPLQVWIDGTAQFEDAVALEKPITAPIVPELALAAEIADEARVMSDVIFTGITRVMLPELEQTFEISANIVVQGGKIVCTGTCSSEVQTASSSGAEIITLRHGHVTPPFTAFGSDLGVSEISSEDSTQNGADPDDVFSRAVDGLQVEGKHSHAAYAHGVANSISAPVYHGGGQHGVSVGFITGASHALEKGAVWNPEIALHYTMTLSAKQGKTPSISSAIAALRRKLSEAINFNDTILDTYSEAYYLDKVVKNKLPLVITVHSADTIAALLRLKTDIEGQLEKNSKINLVLLGAAESHLLATELAASKTSVVLAPLLSYATNWDQRRALSGAPLTNGTAIDALLAAGVLTAIGTTEGETWETRGLGLLAGIAYKNAGGKISENQALGLVAGNFEKILACKIGNKDDFVVFEGSPLEIGGRVKAVGSLGRVDVF